MYLITCHSGNVTIENAENSKQITRLEVAKIEFKVETGGYIFYSVLLVINI